ncbi:TauD/TfdA family dioxygenase [Enterobacterales bacterium AW_CKDN230030176-1A_HGKHYDSX7]
MNTAVYDAAVITDRNLALHVETGPLYEHLRDRGVVVLRRCLVTLDEFSAFVKRHSSRLSLDPGRTLSGGVAQLVDAGTDAVGLHCENGNAPIWPDLTWFYCTLAPRKGSQTTLCDGAAVLDDLSPTTVQRFSEQRIRYRRTVPGDKWRRIVCHYLPEVESLEDATFEQLQAIVGADRNTQMHYTKAQDTVAYAYAVSAIQQSSFHGGAAFANSILGPSFNYEKPVIDFENGEPFDPALLDEVERVTARHTHIVGWQDGDMVMIDNRRVMHGRQPIVDTSREIFNALSYR